MTETSRNLAVGVFATSSLVVLATLMAWFGETPDWLGGNEWTLEITGASDLRGLSPGSPVQLNGVEVGRVKNLRFANAEHSDFGVVVVTGIKEEYSVPEGAHARLYGATLGIGTGRVEIVVEPRLDQQALPKKGAKIPGEVRSIIGELITKDMLASVQRTLDNIGDLAGAAAPAADNLAKLLVPHSVAEVDRSGGKLASNLATVVERLDKFVANLNKILGDVNVQDDVKGVVRDLRTGAETLKETIEMWKSQTQRTANNVNAGVDNIAANLDRSFVKLNQVLDNLDDGSRSLAQTMQYVAEGKGTAGLLVRDDRLYEAAVLSLRRFSEAMASLNAILGKIERDGYITLGSAKDPTGVFTKKIPVPIQASEGE